MPAQNESVSELTLGLSGARVALVCKLYPAHHEAKMVFGPRAAETLLLMLLMALLRVYKETSGVVVVWWVFLKKKR